MFDHLFYLVDLLLFGCFKIGLYIQWTDYTLVFSSVF